MAKLAEAPVKLAGSDAAKSQRAMPPVGREAATPASPTPGQRHQASATGGVATLACGVVDCADAQGQPGIESVEKARLTHA